MVKQGTLLFGIFLVLAFAMISAAGLATSRAASDFPKGTYTAGDYTMVFSAKGQFRVSKGETMQVEGDYKADGDQVTFTDKRGPFACLKAGEEAGKYRWKYETEMLTFTMVEDKCEGRSADLPAQPWKRKK